LEKCIDEMPIIDRFYDYGQTIDCKNPSDGIGRGFLEANET